VTLRPAVSALGALVRVAAISVLALGVPAAAVLGLGDGRVLTPPPESQAEQFVRRLATHRWGPARALLTPELSAALDEEALRAAQQAFERRWGAVVDVRGQAGSASRDQAWATAVVTTSREARVALTLPLLKRSGVWRVAGVESLVALR
jgi:hypothetical protein